MSIDPPFPFLREFRAHCEPRRSPDSLFSRDDSKAAEREGQRNPLTLILHAADCGISYSLYTSVWHLPTPRARPSRRQETSIGRRQWSLGPHRSGSFRALTRTESAISRDAKTKSNWRVAVAGRRPLG